MKTILIVEDQIDVQRLLNVALKQPGRRILQTTDAAEGWRLIQDDTPDLILLDIMMPGEMDGLDLLRKCKQQPRSAAVKIVVISARAQLHDKEAAFAAGADCYLTKPFKLAVLKESVERFLAEIDVPEE